MPKAGQSQLSAHTSFNIEPFSPNTNWFRWVQRLEGAFKLFNISVDQYASFLLHYMGVIAFDIICDKCTPDLRQAYLQMYVSKIDLYLQLIRIRVYIGVRDFYTELLVLRQFDNVK
jgi:hypothetical protein